MTRRMMRCGAPLLTLAFLSAASAVRAETPAGGRFFQYQAYLGGIPVAGGGVEYLLGDDRYRLTFSLQTEGMMSWLFPWTQTTTSQGRFAGGTDEAGAATVSVARHRSESTWRGEGRHTEIAWEGGVPRIESIEPPRESDDHPEVPEALVRGTIDPLSAVFAFGRALGETGTCERTMPVFDGKRRYDMVGIDDGTEVLRPSSYAPVAGEAVRCQFRLETVAGFKETTKVLDKDRSLKGRAWLKPMEPGFPPVPVRIEVETGLGFLMLHLTGTRATADTAAAPPAPEAG